MKKIEEIEEIDLKELPKVNIGIVGHVDHGKTTLTSKLTGKFTDEHSEELKRGISIRLGYADMQIRKCPKQKSSTSWQITEKCINCMNDTELISTVSFIDAPGHETLMATVLCGASIMDCAILVIAANEDCPQPQTLEHLNALELSGIKNVLIVQNKIDLVTNEEAFENYNKIKKFLSNTIYCESDIIPISAQYGANLDILIEKIYNNFVKKENKKKSCEFKSTKQDFFAINKQKTNIHFIDEEKNEQKEENPLFLIARSFDINRPGTEIKDLKGGVIGGSLIRGTLKINDVIQIGPGVEIKGKYKYLKTKIKSIIQGKHKLKKARCGGLIAIETNLDPSLTKSDALVGNIVGFVGKTPILKNTLNLEITYLKRQIIEPIKTGQLVMINIGTARTIGICKNINTQNKKTIIIFSLKLPVCADEKQIAAISKQINGRWRLIAKGVVI